MPDKEGSGRIGKEKKSKEKERKGKKRKEKKRKEKISDPQNCFGEVCILQNSEIV